MLISPATATAIAIPRASPHSSPPFLLANQQPKKPIPTRIILCSKQRPRRRSRSSRKSHHKIIKSIAILASNLKIVPAPFDLIIKEIAGDGNGGGSFGSWFGGGGGSGRGKRGLGFWILIIAASISAIWVGLKRGELKWVGVGFVGIVIWGLIGGRWRSGVVHWGLGFCCGVSVGLNRGELVKWVDEIRVKSCFPIGRLKKGDGLVRLVEKIRVRCSSSIRGFVKEVIRKM
ncbi:hypothetical protein Droror1_Dr00023076 [Drosera rotundifolia]